MSEVISKIPDKLELLEEELETEVEFSKLPNLGSLVSDSLDIVDQNQIFGQLHYVELNHFEEF